MNNIQERVLKAVGTIGAVKLAVLGAYRPISMHTNEIETNVKCAGETYQGYMPFQQLVTDGAFSTEEDFITHKSVGSTPTLDDIALVLLFLSMIYTGHPLELPYTQAAALPLYPNTRVAHLSFTMKVLSIRGSGKLNTTVYKSLEYLSHHHTQHVFDLVLKLKETEEGISKINDDEKEAKVLWKYEFNQNHL